MMTGGPIFTVNAPCCLRWLSMGCSHSSRLGAYQLITGLPIVAWVGTPICRPSRMATLMSKPIVYAPWRSNDAETSWPRPVRSRAISAAHTPAAAAMPAPWSPIPPRWSGGSPPGCVSTCATPDLAQNAPMSYAARSRSGPTIPKPVTAQYTSRGNVAASES